MMKFRSLGVLVLLAAPVSVLAASREIQELQRDVGLLQEQVKSLQSSQNEKLTALTVLVQQSVDAANKANTNVAVIQSSLQQNLKDQESKLLPPVAGATARMDQLSTDFRSLQNAVADLTSSINKIQAQLTDISNQVKIMQTPAAPPPASGVPGLGGPGPNASADTPTIPANDLYDNAQRDRSGGKLDLALQEFSDYLKWYGNTDRAVNAQFYIAYIHYSQADYDDAVKEFDLVLEKYPSDNNKIPDALYYKGMALTRLGRRTQGAEEFKELLKRFPSSDYARQSCSQLTSMGLRCGTTSTTSKGVRRKG
jgi:TolA-binding protein